METEQAEEHLLAVLAAARLGDETIRSEQFTNIAPKNLNLGELECGQTVFDGCQFTNCDFSGTAFLRIVVPTVRFLQLPVPKHLLEGLPVGRCETGRL